MLATEPLGLSANQWQFLSKPDAYVEASTRSGRGLVLESTRRQFLTAADILSRLNGSNGAERRRGLLLADDVGLGKTTVAALVAWVVASAGERRGVRILAPNDVMVRRWEEELLSHVEPLQKCAQHLEVRANRVKARRLKRLSAGTIQVVKHSYASSDFNLACDLLVVDEAHRAKGEGTAFSRALKRQKKYARRVLILTATPFSIKLEELIRMLTLIGAEPAGGPVRTFSRALDDLYTGNTTRKQEDVATRLATKARGAVEALAGFVIRHGIDDLPAEQASFGTRADWNFPVPAANLEEVELIVRMDRALRVARSEGSESLRATNDPRFHVGWRHFDEVSEKLKGRTPQLAEPARAVVEGQLAAMRQLRARGGVHSKMAATGAAVRSAVQLGEKVILFCHHHATAQELTVHLASVLPKATPTSRPGARDWRRAWERILASAGTTDEGALRDTFIDWLCGDLIRAQTGNWLGAADLAGDGLTAALEATPARHPLNTETVAAAAQRLYRTLLGSKSSRAILQAALDRPEVLPGGEGGSLVLGVCAAGEDEAEESLFIHNQQPDTVISVFNSPFGPDVLVVTDKLSEGIDLHRYCRCLIHYELDPSPIRTVQRNGRLRRVNSWAAVIREPILYAYPAFRGTRDHRLVQIMKKRVDSFSLLLGGVQDFEVDDVGEADERWRNEVVATAKARLIEGGGLLRAKELKAL